jgi:hypothetical protein
MPASAAAPFPHLDALEVIFARAAGFAGPGRRPNEVARSLFPDPFLSAGSLLWPWQHAHRVLHEWAAWTRELPGDIASAARIVHLPHLPLVPATLRGRGLVAIEVAIPGEPHAAGERLRQLRRLEPEIDAVAVMDPGSLPALHTSATVSPPAVASWMPLDGLAPAAIDAFVAAIGPASGSHLLTAALRQLGPVHGMTAAGVGTSPEDASRIDLQLARLETRMAAFAPGGVRTGEDVARRPIR